MTLERGTYFCYGEYMDDTCLEIHASGTKSKIWFVLSSLLELLCLWLIFQLALGKPFLQGFLICLLFTLYFTALTLKNKTECLIFKDGCLRQHTIFMQQSVDLPSLVKAKRYLTIGKYPSPRLRLEDEKGGRLVLCPEDYTTKDLETVISLISPYIFITRVDKNFMDLQWIYSFIMTSIGQIRLKVRWVSFFVEHFYLLSCPVSY